MVDFGDALSEKFVCRALTALASSLRNTSTPMAMPAPPDAYVVPDDFAHGYEQLVAQAGALFGSRMYRHYTWLVTLSDHLTSFGLEHHESSDDRVAANELSEAPLREAVAELLAHEYVHSWNGKYRRPAGLVSPDYQQPMDGSLLV